MTDVTETEPPCVGCGSDAPCADHAGRSLCYGCWHAARERETAFVVRRKKDGFVLQDLKYLEHEAAARAAELNAEPRDVEPHNACWYEYDAAPSASGWTGERITHPGYMARRRAALGAK